MTLPDQRTRAVLDAREFLVRLLSPYVENGLKKIPGPVSKEALYILKHFPNAVDVYEAGLDSPDVFSAKEAMVWMREWERTQKTSTGPSK